MMLFGRRPCPVRRRTTIWKRRRVLERDSTTPPHSRRVLERRGAGGHRCVAQGSFKALGWVQFVFGWTGYLRNLYVICLGTFCTRAYTPGYVCRNPAVNHFHRSGVCICCLAEKLTAAPKALMHGRYKGYQLLFEALTKVHFIHHQ